MKLRVEAGKLAHFAPLRGVAAEKSANVWGWVRAEAKAGFKGEKGTLRFAAVTVDTTFVEAEVRCDVAEGGVLLLEGVYFRKLLDVARGMKREQPVEFVLSNKKVRKLHVTAGSFESATTCVVVGNGDFPEVPQLPAGVPALPAAVLSKLFSSVSYAAAKPDGERAQLCCVRLSQSGGVLRAVATDGHRLAKVGCALAGGVPVVEGDGASVPSESVRAVQGYVSDAEGDALFAVRGGRAYFSRSSDGVVQCVSAALLDGGYPDTEKVVRAKSGCFRVGVSALRAGLERASIIGGGKGVDFDVGESVLVLARSNPDLGDFSEEVPISGEEYARAAPRLDVRFALSALEPLSCDEVEVSVGDEHDPVNFYGTGGDDSYVAVVMPVNKQRD